MSTVFYFAFLLRSKEFYLSSGISLQIDSPAVKQNETNKGRRFSPLVFYGSPHGVPPKRPVRLLRLLYEIRRDLSEQNILRYNDKCDHTLSVYCTYIASFLLKSSTVTQYFIRKEVWTTFPRQEDAVKYVKEHNNVHIFSYQDHVNGQRRFLVSSYKEFWRRCFSFFLLIFQARLVAYFILPCKFPHLFFHQTLGTKT